MSRRLKTVYLLRLTENSHYLPQTNRGSARHQSTILLSLQNSTFGPFDIFFQYNIFDIILYLIYEYHMLNIYIVDIYIL